MGLWVGLKCLMWSWVWNRTRLVVSDMPCHRHFMLPWIVYRQLRPLCSMVGAGSLHLWDMLITAHCLPLRLALAHVVRSSLARVICTSKKSLSAAWASWWRLCLRKRYSAFSLNWLGIGDLGHCVVVNSGGISVCSFVGLLSGSADKLGSMSYAVLNLV